MASFKQEFKEFALRGNVMDMAVGIIIGGAFGKIVSSLVDDILMPLIGLITGGVNFTDLKWVIKPAEINAAGEEIVAATTLNYGLFIQNVVDFLIIALVIFMMIRAINSVRKKQEEPEAPAPAPEPSDEVKLLTEIRNLLDKKQ
ncbi:large-conductance mechanosensitive channel protein MscL [Porphyromonas sp.]|uniref:large-conductance mechanosensitive channel protein MscL n=1 Tax=Porphyromonas sp. TaxID=1924944 RepID=UPI0039965630